MQNRCRWISGRGGDHSYVSFLFFSIVSQFVYSYIYGDNYLHMMIAFLCSLQNTLSINIRCSYFPVSINELTRVSFEFPKCNIYLKEQFIKCRLSYRRCVNDGRREKRTAVYEHFAAR